MCYLFGLILRHIYQFKQQADFRYIALNFIHVLCETLVNASRVTYVSLCPDQIAIGLLRKRNEWRLHQ